MTRIFENGYVTLKYIVSYQKYGVVFLNTLILDFGVSNPSKKISKSFSLNMVMYT